MSFRVVSAKLTGNPDSSGWSQVHDFKPDEPEKFKLRGHLFAVIATWGGASGPTAGSEPLVWRKGLRPGGGVDSITAGRELISRLHEEYFGSTKEGAFEALKSAVEKVIAEFSPSWGNVEIAAVSLLEDVVYTVTTGGAQVAIFRDGMLAKILVSQNLPISASGYPKDQDILIAGTREFFRSFPGGVIKGALEGKDPPSAVESLAPAVLAKENKGSLGAVFLKFEKAGVFEEILEKEMAKPKLRIPSAAKIANTLNVFKNVLSSRLSKGLPERKVYVQGTPEEVGFGTQHRKLSASVGILLLGLLIISIFFGIREKRRLDTKARYEPTLSSAQHDFEESINLASLNPERARELFAGSRDKVDILLSQKVGDPTLTELKKKLDENAGKILGEYREEPELFLDLSLLSSGFEGDAMAASGGNLFILDSKGGRIIKILLDSKRSEVVAGPNQIEEAQDLACYTDRVFLLNTKGIFELGKEVKKVASPDWSGQVLLHAYAGNLYVLDKASSSIWRYAATPSGFSSKQNWFGPGVKKDLSGVINWFIDGSIWLLTEKGAILKFANGNPQSFNISGVTPEMAAPKGIYSNEDLEDLYVLDPENSRVVVLAKGGEYKAQYISDKIKEAKSLVVSEKEKKIILLTGQKLLFLEIKHL